MSIPARTIRVKIQSDGTPGGTDVVDAATGERMIFANPDGSVAQYQWHMLFIPGQGGIGKVAIVLDNIPVEAPGVKTPVEMYGVAGKPRPAVEDASDAGPDAAAD